MESASTAQIEEGQEEAPSVEITVEEPEELVKDCPLCLKFMTTPCRLVCGHVLCS